ncbi:MAG: hypothetical protein Q8J76_08390, partial [Desulfobulbaceae bacterium]|nr:hypothetical protein [Desulfobulbaceae bacterium]
MIKPPRELIDAFNTWLQGDPHIHMEDYYKDTINESYLKTLQKDKFIDFFTEFCGDGGKIQSGGHRTKNRF